MKPANKKPGERQILKTVQAATEGTTAWYDAKETDPQFPGYYNVEATNLSSSVERLFWSGWRWLYSESSKVAINLKAARSARWQGSSLPTEASFKAEKRKKTKLRGIYAI